LDRFGRRGEVGGDREQGRRRARRRDQPQQAVVPVGRLDEDLGPALMARVRFERLEPLRERRFLDRQVAVEREPLALQP
jgi:hypothetical protein